MYPHSPADLTVAGLSNALGIDPTDVASTETEIIGQGLGVLCQLARVKFAYRGKASGPKSVVAKFPASIEQTRGLARQFKFYEREVQFYRSLAKEISLPTPQCLYASHDPVSDDFLLLLEDLGDHRLGDQLIGCSAEDAFAAVRQIATLHGEWWNSPKLKPLDWIPFGESNLNKGGMALYPIAWPLYLQQFGAGLPDDVKRVGDRLCDQIAGMLDRARDRPRTICHGDYRLDNMFFGVRPDQPSLTVVDWQITVRSIGTYDVGYFVSQSVSPTLRREIELDLLRAYHDRLTELGVKDYRFADCIDDYRWTLLFCFCYPVMGGGLGDVSNERGVALAKAMTDRCISAIRDWKAFEFLEA
ncbi:phosphotransferase [Bradyrhizobium jicamae]|uniref:Phosphotransferase n=1 Tax=Bradyrhizobium jicamae TaxID=280332 RepID=A0ABS5FYH7_9BRAD|nr:phosphotransferase [Bradyrhizobium jicamae]MBR0801884.1 phosphotransferase [Bradyrhizobium jicamae]